MNELLKTLTSSTASSTASSIESPDSLSAEAIAKLQLIFARINKLGKQTTKTTFEVGEAFNEAYAITGPKFFNAFVEQNCNIGVKQAKNYRNAATNLFPFKDRLIEQGVLPTVMIELSRAHDPDIVEQVLSLFESGEKPSVLEVRNLVKGTDTTAENGDPLYTMGLQAWRKIAETKVRSETAVLQHCIQHVCVHVGLAVTKADGFDHTELVEAMKNEAVTAAGIIDSYGSGLTLSKGERKTVEAYSLPTECQWGDRKSDLLWLTKPKHWPSEGLQAWIATEVLSKLHQAFDLPIPKPVQDLIAEKKATVILPQVPNLAPTLDDLDTLLSSEQSLDSEPEDETESEPSPAM